MHGFVKQSGGHVAIQTAPGKGTTVTIYLPRHAGGAPQADNGPHDASEGTTPGLTVLVDEDEAAVRRTSTEALRELGEAMRPAGLEPATKPL